MSPPPSLTAETPMAASSPPPAAAAPAVLHDPSPSTSDTATDDEQAPITDTDTDTPSPLAPVPDDQLPQTRFHITGFKQFYNVPVNPTQLIVDALPHYLDDHPLTSSACVSSTDVFEAAAKTTLRAINTLYERHAYWVTQQQVDRKRRPRHQLHHHHHHQQHQQQTRTVFVHLGVNMSISHFHLETQAKNEATFSCPDQLGWTPIRHAIDPNDSDITFTRKTGLDLSAIVKRLHTQQFPVDTSNDAGRFVCNWIYYNSLKLSKENNTDALFVHVPSTAVIPLHRQVEFIAALLDAIALTPEL